MTELPHMYLLLCQVSTMPPAHAGPISSSCTAGHFAARFPPSCTQQLSCSSIYACRKRMSASSSSNSGGGAEASQPDARPSSAAPLNMNHYTKKKSLAESMLDVALLMANASQLKAVLEQGPNFSFYNPIITLISISLCLQVTVGILLIFIVQLNLNDEQKHWRLDTMESLATGLVFIIVVVNVFITAFGVHWPHRSD